MITFRQFIAEDGAEELDIPQLCSKFIQESRGLPLFRGTGRRYNAPVQITPRADRRPSNTNARVHDAMDDWFEERFNVRARTAGVFVIGDVDIANTYGYPYFVLPVGDYRYFWCKYEGDYVEDTYDITREIFVAAEGKNVQATTNKIMNKTQWYTDRLHLAIAKNAEITLICSSYIMVPFDTRLSEKERADFYADLIAHDYI